MYVCVWETYVKPTWTGWLRTSPWKQREPERIRGDSGYEERMSWESHSHPPQDDFAPQNAWFVFSRCYRISDTSTDSPYCKAIAYWMGAYYDFPQRRRMVLGGSRFWNTLPRCSSAGGIADACSWIHPAQLPLPNKMMVPTRGPSGKRWGTMKNADLWQTWPSSKMDIHKLKKPKLSQCQSVLETCSQFALQWRFKVSAAQIKSQAMHDYRYLIFKPQNPSW